jgi:hypothetical protein
MASIFRQDTGRVARLARSLARSPTGHKAWPHSDGKSRAEPEKPTPRKGLITSLPAVTLNIPVRNDTHGPDVHLIVPPEFVDFIVTHRLFRAASPAA